MTPRTPNPPKRQRWAPRATPRPRARLGPRRRSLRGQTIVVLALVALAVFGFGAIALDASIGMADRRDLQSVVDSAALAGARQWTVLVQQNQQPQPAAEHYVALQYLARELGFSPNGVTGCTSASSCPAGTYKVGDYTFTFVDQGGGVFDLSLQHRNRSLIAGVLGFATTVSGTGGRVQPTNPQLVGATYALAAVGGDAQIHGGGTSNPTGDVTGPVYAQGSFGANNPQHKPTLPGQVTNFDGTRCSPSQTNHVDLGGSSNGLQYRWSSNPGTENPGRATPTPFDGDAPIPPPITYTSPSQAKDANGNWRPGLYNGFFPTGGELLPGVFKIVNVTSPIDFGSITNEIGSPPGTQDTTGAVAIVLDGSDTGQVVVSPQDTIELNGIDDLQPANSSGPRDPLSTHNFVIYGGGSNPYTAGVVIRGNASVTLSGIVYLPKSSFTYDGTSTVKTYGSLYAKDVTINGGGNGTQTFSWICNLSAVSANGSSGGLVR